MTMGLIATAHWKSALPRRRTLLARLRGLTRLFSARRRGTLCNFRHVAPPENRLAVTSALISFIYAEITQTRDTEIKSAQQRVAKATEERDKQKEKLKRAEARLKAEKDNLRTNQEKLES